jgi:hypothetical protein
MSKLPHPVPARVGQVVEMRDGHHDGTAVWRRDDNAKPFAFASHDRRKVEYAERVALMRDVDVEEIPPGYPYGCDLDSGIGLVLLGIEADEDPRDVVNGEVLWDSAATE